MFFFGFWLGFVSCLSNEAQDWRFNACSGFNPAVINAIYPRVFGTLVRLDVILNMAAMGVVLFLGVLILQNAKKSKEDFKRRYGNELNPSFYQSHPAETYVKNMFIYASAVLGITMTRKVLLAKRLVDEKYLYFGTSLVPVILVNIANPLTFYWRTRKVRERCNKVVQGAFKTWM